VFWLSVFNPFVGTWPAKAGLGSDHEVRRIRVQRLRYDFFAHVRAIGIRGIDEIDSQLDSAPQHPDGLGPIRGLSPNSLPRNSHRAESQARNPKVVSDQEFSRFFSGLSYQRNNRLAILHMFSFPPNDEI
jgi:hypothetical protein